jgi:hypothetical protein
LHEPWTERHVVHPVPWIDASGGMVMPPLVPPVPLNVATLDWSRVLTTSNGQVTMAPIVPPAL